MNCEGQEILGPTQYSLKFACPGAGTYPITTAALTMHYDGRAVAIGDAVFDVCLRGPKLSTIPPASDWQFCQGDYETDQETSADWVLRVHGRWRFSHPVRCVADTPQAKGTRLFYGVTTVEFPYNPRTYSTNSNGPPNYRCPGV